MVDKLDLIQLLKDKDQLVDLVEEIETVVSVETPEIQETQL